MTQEEYEQEQREIERLIDEINRIRRENAELVDEINLALENINTLCGNVRHLNHNFTPVVRSLSGEVEMNSVNTQAVEQAIRELTEQYFTFKSLSTASKDLTRYTDEYYTRFSYYNNLRRITLGYVIGLDSNFVSSERMRSAVERAYLTNTQYWLAYATMAVMLWASEEKEAAQRALDKALFISPQKAALYFMLINLRFSRTQTAQNWFVNYMDRVNPSDLGQEWQYLLQSYLAGAFGTDEAFQNEVGRYFKKMIAQSEATTVDFNKRFIDRAYRFEENYLHHTKVNYPYLKNTCPEYDDMIGMLTDAEKNALIARYYDDLINEEDDRGEDIYQRIENVLYALVNEYDDDELVVVKRMKLAEHIISAQGDEGAARRKLEEEFDTGGQKNFADLLTDWAFVEDSRITPLSVRRFAVSCMWKWMCRGYEKFAENYRSREKQAYAFNIDGCSLSCTEDDFVQGSDTIAEYYSKNKRKFIMSDQHIKIYGLITLAGVALLVILALMLFKRHFSPVALTAGILLVLLGSFLLWRQIVSCEAQLKEKQRLSIQRLGYALEELRQWRQLFRQEDAKLADLEDALSRFGSGEE